MRGEWIVLRNSGELRHAAPRWRGTGVDGALRGGNPAQFRIDVPRPPALLTRSPLSFKLSSRGCPASAGTFARRSQPKLGVPRNGVVAREHRTLEDALLHRADCVVVQGSDETVSAIRPRVAPRAQLLAYGHRLSFGFVGADALSGYGARKVCGPRSCGRCRLEPVGMSVAPRGVRGRGAALSPRRLRCDAGRGSGGRESTEPQGTLSPEEAGENHASRRALHQEVRAVAI